MQYVEEYDNVGESVQVTRLDTGRTAKFTIDASYGTAKYRSTDSLFGGSDIDKTIPIMIELL